MNVADRARCMFRRAGRHDIDDIMRIRFAVRENRLSDPSRVTPQMCEGYLERDGRGWVCECDGAVVGFSFAARDGSIWALFVDPAHEGLGIGRRLLALAVEWLFALGHLELVLDTAIGTRAERFYAEQGWRRGGRVGSTEVRFTLRRPG